MNYKIKYKKSTINWPNFLYDYTSNCMLGDYNIQSISVYFESVMLEQVSNIHQYLISRFFIQKCNVQLFPTSSLLGFVIFCQKNISAKAAQKMLVKLTTGIEYHTSHLTYKWRLNCLSAIFKTSGWEFTKLLTQIRNIFLNFKVLLQSSYS